MTKVYVKICGLTQPGQARKIAQAGADAIGVVFADSPRQVSPEKAREIVAALPAKVPAVGVFVNATTERINLTVKQTGIACAQLHGDEPAEVVAAAAVPCIKTFRVRDAGWIEQVNEFLHKLTELPCRISSAFPQNLLAILLDTYSPTAAGGTGEAFNWNLPAEARKTGQLKDFPPIILAGGLTADNVAGAITKVQPWGVDVSGGVEKSHGIKNLDEVRRFIQAAKQG